MKRPKKALLELVVIAGAMLTAGCIPGHPLTVEDQAQKVYNDMRKINNTAQKYIKKHGDLPAGSARSTRALLFTDKKFPTPPPEIFAGKPMEYQLTAEYDRMDAGPISDAAIAVWGLKDSVCIEYNLRFASAALGPVIYDNEQNNNRYPGEAIGREMITYAIKWKTADVDDCEIEWVVKYR